MTGSTTSGQTAGGQGSERGWKQHLAQGAGYQLASPATFGKLQKCSSAYDASFNYKNMSKKSVSEMIKLSLLGYAD